MSVDVRIMVRINVGFEIGLGILLACSTLRSLEVMYGVS